MLLKPIKGHGATVYHSDQYNCRHESQFVCILPCKLLIINPFQDPDLHVNCTCLVHSAYTATMLYPFTRMNFTV